MPIYFTMLRYAPLCSSLQCLPGCVPHLIASPPLSHRLTSGGRTYADNQTPEPSPPVQMEEKWTKEVLVITFLVIMTKYLLSLLHCPSYSLFTSSVLCVVFDAHCKSRTVLLRGPLSLSGAPSFYSDSVAGGWWLVPCSASGSDSEWSSPLRAVMLSPAAVCLPSNWGYN